MMLRHFDGGRDALSWIGRLCLLGLLLGLAGCGADAMGDVGSRGGRGRTIEDGWRFVRDEVPGADAVAFDDAAWQAVTLPHTWNAVDGSDGGRNYYRGAAWYRRSIDVDAATLTAGKRFYVRFGAAALVADVYVNGDAVGQHRGGFSAFCFDVTDRLHAGANVLAVRVDNRRQPDVAPQAGDFTVFGGLYRDVEWLVLEPLHVSPIDDASGGVYVRQSEVSERSATIDVTTMLRNTGAGQPGATVEVSVVDAAGTAVNRAVTPAALGAHADGSAVTHLVIDRPRLWDGVRSPTCYGVNVTVRDSAGKVVDAVAQRVGLRSFSVDAEHGVTLNGKHYAAHGVNIHQEVADKGWAGLAEDYALNYKLVRELGATCVRMAHYQHNEAEYALCDANGLVVWAEIPLVNEFGKSPAFAENVKQQLRELIKQNYNHPSILFWGLWNELAANPDDPHWQLVRECNALAHELDPSRPTTAAHHRDPKFSIVDIPDLIAFNRYAGWYSRAAEDWGNEIDTDHAATPGRPMAVSEYGAGASTVQHELNPARVTAGGPWHPEEYQSLVHEQAWRAMKARPYLWGTFIWNMFDFSADHRAEGDHAGRNDKGLVTIDRKTKKDAFYFYQANWTTEPMVHITSARYDPYPIGKSAVKVYSNCDAVELFQDGRSLGKRVGGDGVFVWPDVAFTPGRSTLVARGERGDGKGSVRVVDEVTRTVSAEASTRTTPKRPPATTRAATTTAP